MLGFELDFWDYVTFATLAFCGAGFMVTMLWIAGLPGASRWRASIATPKRLPAGCISPDVQGKKFYLCSNTWFTPSCSANGVFYTVVTAPTWRARDPGPDLAAR